MLNTLIIDHEGIYDPNIPNDRLLLGMKGTISEIVLSTFRQRPEETIEQKARCEGFFNTFAAEYKKVYGNKIEIDPNILVLIKDHHDDYISRKEFEYN